MLKMIVHAARRVLFILGAAFLLLNAGNCVFPLFASQEANDCCTRGKCTSKNGDDCCSTATGALAGKHFEQASRSADLPALDFAHLVATDVAHLQVAITSAHGAVLSFHEHGPPGGEPLNTNLPLLI
jgi:hypothetical protein